MKKTRLLLSILGISILISGCNTNSSSMSSTKSVGSNFKMPIVPIDEGAEYKLLIKDERKLIVDQPHLLDSETANYFKEGKKVYFRTSAILNEDLIVLLNDQELGRFYSSANNYFQYEFVMPSMDSSLEVYIRGDASHVNKEIDLKDEYTWIKDLKEENITRVISGRTTGSICPSLNRFNRYYYSDETSEIHRVFEYLNNTKIVFDYPNGADGVGQDSLIIETLNLITNKKEQHGIGTILNVLVVDGKNASLSKALPKMSESYGDRFMYLAVIDMQVEGADGSDYSELFPGLYKLSSLFFQKVDNPSFSNESNEYNKYKIKNELGTIVFESETEFRVCPEEGEEAAYRIVEGFTFKDLKIEQY